MVRKAPQPLAQGKHAQAFALAGPVPQRVELRPECLTDRGRNGHEFLWELEERVAQAGAHAYARKERAHALGRAVEAIGQDPPDSIRRLLLGRRALKLPTGPSEGGGTGVLGIPQMPDHAATDNRGEIHLVGETVTVLFVGQEVDRQWETASGQYRHQTVVAKRTDEAIEGHWRNMSDHGTE